MHKPLRVAVVALKRLDTFLAAALSGYCAGSLAQAWLCDDWSCSSNGDTTVYFTAVALGAAGATFLLWRYTRRWWSRAAVLPVALYAVLVVPPLILAQGRWTLRPAAGARCVVRAGALPENVHRDCGVPSYGCEGPKFIEGDSKWNPLALRVCAFRGDVYEDRLVTYDCSGVVVSVEAFSGERRPQGCLWQR
jgi:hypothetical protein